MRKQTFLIFNGFETGKNGWIIFSILLLFLVGFAPFPLHAGAGVNEFQKQVRNLVIKGTVKDANGEPIIGATVRIKGVSDKGTVSDIDGNFTLEAGLDDELSVSYIGYQTKIVRINNRATLNIVLTENSSTLSDIVVVGYGIQKKASVTGSVASITSDQLNEVKAPNVTNMLAGRLPGLRAVQRSGAPGDDAATVDIRGYGNMLVIVDGVERDYSQLDPNDIASISILKDAAAAVYGFKGSNGVLLVTTKQGKAQKVKIDYNGYFGLQSVTRYPKMMNAYEYATLYNEAVYNSNPWTASKVYSNSQLEKFRNGTSGTDWWSQTMRNSAPQTSHNLSLTGGTDRVNYYLSAGYLGQQGLLRSGDWNYRRYNVRSNISVNAAKGLKIDLQLAGLYDDREKPYNADNLFRSAQMAIPTYSVFANDNSDYWGAVGDMANPVHLSYSKYSGYDNRYRHEFNSSLSVTWDIPWISGLSAKAMMAYDYSNTEWKTWRRELVEYTYDSSNNTYTGSTVNTAHLESKQENYNKPTYQISLNYNTTFLKRNKIGAMLLWEMYNDKDSWVSGDRDFSLGLIPELNYGNTTNQSATGNTSKTAHAGLVGKLNYDYDSRYLMEFDCRYDGTYKFQRGSRWGFFPGISVGWRMSEENFMKNAFPLLDNLKLRASYAKVGDEGDFSAFQYLEGYTSNGTYILGSGGVTTGMTSTGMANTWLTWYESKIMNLGFDFSYDKGLISLQFDWFRRHRTGLPATREGSLPTTFGESMPEENLNSDINTGYELVIGHKGNIGKFKYDLSANFSTTTIKYDHVETAASANKYENWRNNTNNRNENIQWGLKVIGQFTSYADILSSPIQDDNGNKTLLPGDLKFEDYNGDGIINDEDEQPIGRGTTPTKYYGLNINGEYSGFDMTVFLQGASGDNVFISGDILDTFIQQGLGNGLEIMTNRWHRADPTDPYSEWIPGIMPAARVSGSSYNRSSNSWSLHDASYIRLKTLELGYTLPAKLIKTLPLERVRFFVNGYNLLTFTKDHSGLMKYIDPENSTSNLRYYPQMKTYNFGVNITF